ncbi:hypothetical protein L1279_002054 [Planomicrobium sp. HSC-17F08]|nr:hypothetical protein [Planomicrobium sp. HSC-17F08]
MDWKSLGCAVWENILNDGQLIDIPQNSYACRGRAPSRFVASLLFLHHCASFETLKSVAGSRLSRFPAGKTLAEACEAKSLRRSSEAMQEQGFSADFRFFN